LAIGNDRFAVCNLQSSGQSGKSLLRPGFTLLEVVIALALCLVLLSAVYGALELYARYSTVGREQIERSQVARAVLRRMTSDVQSIVFQVPEATSEEDAAAAEEGMSAAGESTSGSQSGSGTTDSGEESIVVEETEDAYTGTSVGLIGDLRTLMLHISRPVRNVTYLPIADAERVTMRTSDQISVSYFLAESGGAGLSDAVSQLTGTGLARLDGDRFAIEHADVQQETDVLAAEAKIVAPEVIDLQFRYWDGTLWLETWDSVALGALPQAIEVTLWFATSEAAARGPSLFSLTETVVTPSVRYVIAVPLATPAAALQAETEAAL
jgi:prepilin-type N-terminal cleavage/methylation domain-containing protein